VTKTATPQEFLHRLRVYIEDTDAGGIVYYVNYLKFMERARTEFMRVHGYGKTHIFNKDLMFVVQRVAVNYRSAAQLDDELEASARLVSLRGARIVFYQSIRRGEEVLAEGEITVACVDHDQRKPRRLPADMLARLREVDSQNN